MCKSHTGRIISLERLRVGEGSARITYVPENSEESLQATPLGICYVGPMGNFPTKFATFKRYESDEIIFIPKEVYRRVYGNPNGRQRKKAASKTSEDGSRYTAKPRNKF